MRIAINVGLIFLGAYLIYSAAKLSVIYNGWTSSVRGRHPNLNPPPTPEWLKRNTKIMTWIFRIAGALLILRSILLIIANA